MSVCTVKIDVLGNVDIFSANSVNSSMQMDLLDNNRRASSKSGQNWTKGHPKQENYRFIPRRKKGRLL